jgi:hypothetical protein
MFHEDIVDEAHRLRMSGTPFSKFRTANGMLVKMASRDYNMHMASCILSLEPQYRWMITATPLVNVIEDLHWILNFLETSPWLTLQLAPDTFDYTLYIGYHEVADRSNVSGSKSGAGFTPVADLFKKGPEFGSLVYCTTRLGMLICCP